jgi:thiol-disulfide isomerase/thioredoxin
MRILAALAVLFLSACSFLQSEPEKQQQPTPPVVTQEMPIMNDSMGLMEPGMEHEMMVHTAALSEGCDALTAKSAEEKAQILQDISHNMDKNALDMILGKNCAFLETVAVLDIEEDDLKLNPEDTETLYFSSETNQFFVTCMSMNTVAYVVERLTDDTPEKYFDTHKSKFAAAAKTMKDMMQEMEKMEGMDMEMMKGGDAPEESEESGAVEKGAYINARNDLAIAFSAIGNGTPALLFFHASWCGSCKAKDEVLTGFYEEGSYPVSTYKIDFDTAEALKAKYGISSQDTVVLVDGTGKAIETIMGASEADLQRMISG